MNNTMNTKEKGDWLEDIVESIYKEPGVDVFKKANVPVLHSLKNKRTREIDILITKNISGIIIKIAIECKNHIKPIGAPLIDAFIGKLNDIGIPPQQSIFITTSRFTKGAKDIAQKERIQLLVLNESNKEDVLNKVTIATQSYIYLLLDVMKITIKNEIPALDNLEKPWQVFNLYDEDSKYRCNIFDLLWHKWINGLLPVSLGLHEFEIEVPEKWQSIVNNKHQNIYSAKIEYQIIALVGQIKSEKLQKHILVDAHSKSIKKTHVQINFKNQDEVTLREFYDDNSLDKHIKPNNTHTINIRIPLPRIKNRVIYWPPSQRVWEQMQSTVKKQSKEQFDFLKLEGSSLNSVFEPIADTYYINLNKEKD